MPGRLESCHHGTWQKRPAAGASLASRYSLLGNSPIFEAKGTVLFSESVFTFPKAIKESLNFKVLCKGLKYLIKVTVSEIKLLSALI